MYKVKQRNTWKYKIIHWNTKKTLQYIAIQRKQLNTKKYNIIQ